MFRSEAQGLVQRFADGESKGYSFVLEILLRMRQFSVMLSGSRLIVGSLVDVSRPLAGVA
jgi:hypothetical protein